jgi:hypothetical protein
MAPKRLMKQVIVFSGLLQLQPGRIRLSSAFIGVISGEFWRSRFGFRPQHHDYRS